MWPSFISGRHHKDMASAFERVARGELRRLIINMPPRHTKSEFASYLLPAWFLGKFPEKKVIQTAHTAELAVGFGRKVRNLIQSEDFGKVFPKVPPTPEAFCRWQMMDACPVLLSPLQLRPPQRSTHPPLASRRPPAVIGWQTGLDKRGSSKMPINPP